jgi:hypothetical protein
MVILRADRAQAAVVEASLLVLRARAHAVLVKLEVVTNLDQRVPPVQGDPLARVGVVRKAPVRKQVRVRQRVVNTFQALVQSKAVSSINIANLAKVVHVARVARAAQVAPVAQALQLGPVVQVSQPVRVVRPNKVVLGGRALVLANQRVEISLDQAIQVLDRHRKAMIGNRAGLQHMSPDWGLPSLRVVVVSEMSVFRG